ncbi:hypothetical protein GYH30_031733 [Glycine max]|uniref:DUF3456 domain-containing protein n=2 Tax=Glycine subgen. Soja TaxID=1462606 RepID=A0A0R0HK44_SOYBN|nr:hypothetical protein GYH30_031733 [Glycine max]RZB81134.1 hypothetical protein D0Y65_030755 [Glycine soja]
MKNESYEQLEKNLELDANDTQDNHIKEITNKLLIIEKPHNHLDMHHHLDSKGQHQGKLIDYRVSELRVVELHNGLCEMMQNYTLKVLNTNTYEWFKVDCWEA